MDKFIHVRSAKSPILPDGKEELVNGKALAEYLQDKLRGRGYDAPFRCCGDWGWWVEFKTAPFTFGVCIYWGPERAGTLARKKWSWRRFRFVDTAPYVNKLQEDLVSIFQDRDVQVLSTSLDLHWQIRSSRPTSGISKSSLARSVLFSTGGP